MNCYEVLVSHKLLNIHTHTFILKLNFINDIISNCIELYVLVYSILLFVVKRVSLTISDSKLQTSSNLFPVL